MEKPDAPSADDAVVREVVGTIRELLHRLLMSSVPAWIDLRLTLPQLRTIFIVAHNGTSSVMHIAHDLGVGTPTASHLIERLVRAGLVDRGEDPEDRRRAVVRLSAEGEQLIERLLGWEELLYEWLQEIPHKDLRSFRDGLDRLMISLQSRTMDGGSTSEQGR